MTRLSTVAGGRLILAIVSQVMDRRSFEEEEGGLNMYILTCMYVLYMYTGRVGNAKFRFMVYMYVGITKFTCT